MGRNIIHHLKQICQLNTRTAYIIAYVSHASFICGSNMVLFGSEKPQNYAPCHVRIYWTEKNREQNYANLRQKVRQISASRGLSKNLFSTEKFNYSSLKITLINKVV
jgi:hypothetical protein